MTIYQAVFKVLSKNKFRLIISILLMLGVTFFYHLELPDDYSDQQDVMIASLQDKDQSAESQAFIKYLKEIADINVIPKTSASIEDSYFEEVDYYLTIPADFSTLLKQQEKINFSYTETANQRAKEYIEKAITRFIHVYQQKQSVHSDSQELLTRTLDELKETEGVQRTTKIQKVKTGTYMNVLGYCLFFTIFSGYCVLSISFNQRELQERILQGRTTAKHLISKLSLGGFLYSFVLFLFFTWLTLLLNFTEYQQMLPYYLLNTVTFYLSIVSFSMMICGIFTKAKILNGVKDVYITGICFISGILIPIDYLSQGVQDIASLTPVYWFAKTNRLIESAQQFDSAFQQTFLGNVGVVAAFALLFVVIYLITLKEKGVLVIEQSLRKT